MDLSFFFKTSVQRQLVPELRLFAPRGYLAVELTS